MVGLGVGEVAGTEHAREALHVHGRNDVVHRLEDTRLSVGIARQQALLGVLARKPGGDRRELGQHRVVVFLQGRDLGLRVELHEGRAVLLAVGAVDLLQLVGLADFLEQHMDADRAGTGHVIELHWRLPFEW